MDLSSDFFFFEEIQGSKTCLYSVVFIYVQSFAKLI